jgi:hypothetical protein
MKRAEVDVSLGKMAIQQHQVALAWLSSWSIIAPPFIFSPGPLRSCGAVCAKTRFRTAFDRNSPLADIRDVKRAAADLADGPQVADGHLSGFRWTVASEGAGIPPVKPPHAQ